MLNMNFSEKVDPRVQFKLNMREKRERVRNQREHEYGVNFVNSFNKTCMLRTPHQLVYEPIM